MSQSTPGQPPLSPTANRLLAALPRAEYDGLVGRMEVVKLGALEVIANAGEPLSHAYFPLSGILSIVAIDAAGGIVEVGTVGRDGMAGLPTVLGLPASPFQTMGQVPGFHARLPMADLLVAAAPGTALYALLLRYAQAFSVLGGQSAACNRLHPVEERCARWLLMTHDRIGADVFPLTQEVLGQMLGVRRPSVTVAAGMLQRAGLIGYRRGIVTILDRSGLEAAACECYGVIQREFDRLFG
ncbi:MAG: Crp/Fnr family transcriptional regulator [Thermomicrobiales bacterium]